MPYENGDRIELLKKILAYETPIDTMTAYFGAEGGRGRMVLMSFIIGANTSGALHCVYSLHIDSKAKKGQEVTNYHKVEPYDERTVIPISSLLNVTNGISGSLPSNLELSVENVKEINAFLDNEMPDLMGSNLLLQSINLGKRFDKDKYNSHVVMSDGKLAVSNGLIKDTSEISDYCKRHDIQLNIG